MGSDSDPTRELAAGYSPVFRGVEIASILIFAVLLVRLGQGVFASEFAGAGLLVGAFLAGWLAADFISGLVHWGADTWGSAKFPVLGPTLIRSFREHHVDQTAITRHDFIETNGASCLVCLPVLAFALTRELTSAAMLFAVAAMGSLCFWILMTNQAHKWAHEGERAPWAVRWLQSFWVLLPAHRHARHHCAPFVESYCITTGWMNPLLNRIGFFRGLEHVVTRTTGLKPRQEDLKLTAAAKAISVAWSGSDGKCPPNAPSRPKSRPKR